MIEYKLQTYLILAAERNTFAMYGGTLYLTECTKETISKGRVARTNIPQF